MNEMKDIIFKALSLISDIEAMKLDGDFYGIDDWSQIEWPNLTISTDTLKAELAEFNKVDGMGDLVDLAQFYGFVDPYEDDNEEWTPLKADSLEEAAEDFLTGKGIVWTDMDRLTDEA